MRSIAPLGDWYQAFKKRFPGQIVASDEVCSQLTQFLYLIDSTHPQNFAVDENGAPVFRLADLGHALGIIDYGHFIKDLLANPHTARDVHWAQFWPDMAPEPGLNLGQLVVRVFCLPPLAVADIEYMERLAALRAITSRMFDLMGISIVGAEQHLNALVAPRQAPSTEPPASVH